MQQSQPLSSPPLGMSPVTIRPPQPLSKKQTRILIVEDDLDLNALIKFHLDQTKQFEVTCLFDGALVMETIERIQPDLIVLDVMLPGQYGTEVLANLRKHPRFQSIPVVLLTARSHESDRIEGLQMGADDYVTKPFSPKELMLRLDAILRRTQKQDVVEENTAAIKIGPLEIDKSEHRVLVNQELVTLTVIEFNLLNYLAIRVGRLSSREMLLKDVWNYGGQVNTRTVDTHIKRLRQKLGAAGYLIETQHGFGYKLVQP